MRCRPDRILTLDRTHASCRGLKGCWPFHDRGGTTIRGVAKRRSLTLAGAATSVAWRVGRWGRGAECDGVVNWSGPPATDLWPAGTVAGSVAMLVRCDQVASQNRLFGAAASGAGLLRVDVGTVASAFSVTVKNGSNANLQIDTPATLVNGGYYCLVITIEDGDARIYLDGKQVASSSSVSGANTFAFDATGVRVAANSNGLTPFVGGFYDLRLYDRALRPREVQRYWRAPWEMMEPLPEIEDSIYTRIFVDDTGAGADAVSVRRIYRIRNTTVSGTRNYTTRKWNA